MLRVASNLRKKIPNVPRWAIGLAIATPTAALCQGALYLQEYRRNHGDTPTPVSPSRGIVVMKSDEETNSFSLRPLRLLVVGDSLAAGVGISKQSTPVLPESIARSLSIACGGRAVSWTCVGRPGASSTQIVQDILSYETPKEPHLFETKFAEWQAAKFRAQEWLEKRKKLEEVAAPNKLRQWWSNIQRDISTFRSQVLVRNDSQVRKIVQRRRLSTARAVNADEYDIAVVLTGLNDLKDACLPFLTSGANSATTAEARKLASPDGLQGELRRMLDVLKARMRIDNVSDSENYPATKPISKDDMLVSGDRAERRQGPLVVFPAMPAQAARAFRQAPLSWFLLPLIEKMDEQKKHLAQQFPKFVLYVEKPSIEDYQDIEAGRGPLFTSRKAEQVVLELTDVTQRAKEQVLQLMKQHYKRWTNDRKEPAEEVERDIYQPCCHDHLQQNADTRAPGSSLMAADDIHPNDEGYDFWGRHIAAAIVEEWELRKSQR